MIVTVLNVFVVISKMMVSNGIKDMALIKSPTMLTTTNCVNWLVNALFRESGYVQNRFQRKLLITAAMNEIILAKTALIEKKETTKLKIPKSIIAPMVPTNANFKNRVRSFLSTIMLIVPFFPENKEWFVLIPVLVSTLEANFINPSPW